MAGKAGCLKQLNVEDDVDEGADSRLLTLLCCQALFPMTHRPQTDIFVIICIGFQEALSLLVYRNLWYMDAQVCFLKVLFITWIDHFFQNSTEISSDGRSKTLITFRLINLFDWSVPC